MAQITIRRLDDEIVKRLRIRAAEAGHSMEEEARRTLARSLGVDRQAVLEEVRKFRAAIGPHRGPISTEIIRGMRDKEPAWLQKMLEPKNAGRRR